MMNDYLEKHPLVQYALIILLTLLLNLYWRYSKGYAWTDIWTNTLFLSTGVIIGDRLRRKQNQKNAAAKEKIDELLRKDE